MSKNKNHLGPHKYFKQQTATGKNIFRCGLQGCPHFVYEAIITNRPCICWRCGEIFTTNRANIRTKYFHCIGCTKTREVKSVVAEAEVDTLIDELLK